jgi:ribosome-associated protein
LAAATRADAHFKIDMSRKPTKGYFVRGQFVALGSELDLELKRELKGSDDMSKTDLKKYSDRLQELGESLLTLRTDLMQKLDLSEKLVDAVAEARRITNFEGRRRQMQYIGKLMRGVDEATLAAVEAALDEQNKGSAQGTLSLHQAEQWRDRLIADDEALTHWLQLDPSADVQPLRALIRQARKDAQATHAQERPGEAVRHGKAYRELFQTVKAVLNQDGGDAPGPHENEEQP